MWRAWKLRRLAGLLLALALLPSGISPPSPADADGDGYPDALRLVGQDRARFADWFASVAESQFYGMSADWRPESRDCSGLVRYAFSNALMPHDAAWFRKFAYLPRPQLPSVVAYGYPLPILGKFVFRVAPGAYRWDDIQAGRFVGRTTVQYLANYSSVRVSRDPGQARRGDLLIFLRPALGSYHSMIYLGGGRVVYHTGARPEEGGEVRLVTLATLMRHPDPAFRPTPSNPNFLGVYRFKILEGGE